MKGRLICLPFVLAAALAGCGGQRVPSADKHLPASIATPPNDAALLRVSRSGGTAQLLRANTLVARSTAGVEGLPAITRILGASLEDETVYASDNAGRLLAIDLKSQRSRLIPTTARQFTTTADGTILGVDSSHHPVRLVNRAFITYKVPVDRGATLFRAPAEQVLVVGNHPGTLQVLGAAGEVRKFPLPPGRIAASWVGDMVAVTTDSGIAFVDPSGRPLPRKAPAKFVRVKGTPVVAAFSPSGHRLYVGRKTGGLVMVDRFNRTVLKELALPGVPDGLRADRTGRWLMAHGAKDSLWVVDLTRWAVAWTGVAPWAEDLPQVVDGHMLLMRRKADLMSIDLAGAETPEKGVLSGGASDLYIMLPWVPRSGSGTGATAEPAVTARSSAAAPTDPPAATDPAAKAPPAAAPAGTTPAPGVASATPPAAPPPAPSPTGTTYVQVSSSQNSDWAAALAKQLKDGGFPAKVLDPKTSDESYRVVVGPYSSREDADAVGKRLGRPYFIITAGSGDT